MINSLDFPLKEGTLSLPLILRMFSLETEIFIPRNISVTAYFFAVFIPYKMFIHLFSNFHDLWWDACYYFCDCFSLCNVFFFLAAFKLFFSSLFSMVCLWCIWAYFPSVFSCFRFTEFELIHLCQQFTLNVIQEHKSPWFDICGSSFGFLKVKKKKRGNKIDNSEKC